MFQTLQIDTVEAGIARLLFTGTGRGNAMGPAFWDELPLAVQSLATRKDIRVLLVQGSGAHYSYGLDLPGMAGRFGEVLADGAAGRAAIIRMAAHMQSGFNALAALPQPVIACIDGWCIGAGVEMIAACDLRLGTAAARFALREVNVGIVADLGGIQRLPYLIGEGLARELALTGRDMDAPRAERCGLLNSVHADAPALDAAALELARRLAAQPPLVLAGIKQVMNARFEGSVLAGLREAATLNGLLMQSEDFAEAMRAFMEKRPPVYQGR